MRGTLRGAAIAGAAIAMLPCTAMAGLSLADRTVAQPQVRYAAAKPWVRQTIRGQLIIGAQEGVIKTATGKLYPFDSSDPMARRLVKACGSPDGYCEADVLLDREEIIKVQSARMVRWSSLSDREREQWKQRRDGK